MAERKRMTEAVSSLFESAFRGTFTRRCLGRRGGARCRSRSRIAFGWVEALGR